MEVLSATEEVLTNLTEEVLSVTVEVLSPLTEEVLSVRMCWVSLWSPSVANACVWAGGLSLAGLL